MLSAPLANSSGEGSGIAGPPNRFCSSRVECQAALFVPDYLTTLSRLAGAVRLALRLPCKIAGGMVKMPNLAGVRDVTSKS